jgi:hypothetical protein
MMRLQTCTRSVRLATLSLGFCLVTGAAGAEGAAKALDIQASERLVGSRVRVEAPGQFEGRMVGTVLELREGQMVLGLEGRRLPIRREAIRRIDVSIGRQRHARTGALAGAALGAVGGAVYLSTVSSMSHMDFDERQYGLATLSGAVGGTMLGALVGHLIESERWQPVTPVPVRVSVRPVAERGLTLGLTVEF